MRKLIFIFFLLISVLVNAQLTNVPDYRIASSSVVFGVPISVGSKIYVVNTGKYYVATASLASTSTVTSASGSLFELTGYIPYSGASSNVSLGSYSLTSSNLISSQYVTFSSSPGIIRGVSDVDIQLDYDDNSTSAFHVKSGAGSSILTISESGSSVFTSSVTGSSFITSGGTSSQFVKGDGTLDGTTYLPTNTKLVAIGNLANSTGWLYNNGSGTFSYSTPSKSDIGLSNVENTALSTWAGSTNLTTLGTITTGIWNGSAIGDTYISSASTWNAKQNALVSGTNIKTINSTSLLDSGDIAIAPMVYPGAGIPISTGSAWGTSITDNSTNWNTAYSDRLKWDGGSTDLVASTGRTSLGGTTVGQNIFTKTNPSAITFLRANADNTVDFLNATDFRTAIGVGTGTFVTDSMLSDSLDLMTLQRVTDNDSTTTHGIIANDIIVKNPYIDIRAFGGVGDGVTDNTTAFSNAIAALPDGGIIFIPDGTFLTNIVITESIILIGNGKSTILKAYDSEPVIKLDGINNYLNYVKIADMTIDGATTSTGIQMTAESPNVVSKSLISNLDIINVTIGIELTCPSGNVIYSNSIENIRILSPTTYGILILNGAYNSFANIEISNVSTWGIYSTSASSNFKNIFLDGLIYSNGPDNYFENIVFETISDVSPPSDIVFKSVGPNTTINKIIFTSVDNAAIDYGLALFGNNNKVSNFRIYGTSTISYPFSLESSSSGIIENTDRNSNGYTLPQYTSSTIINSWEFINTDLFGSTLINKFGNLKVANAPVDTIDVVRLMDLTDIINIIEDTLEIHLDTLQSHNQRLISLEDSAALFSSRLYALEGVDKLLQIVANGDRTASFVHPADSASIGNYNLSTAGAVVVSIHNLQSGYMGTIFLDVATAPASITVTGYSDAGTTELTNKIQLATIAFAANKMTTVTYTCANDGTNLELILTYSKEP